MAFIVERIDRKEMKLFWPLGKTILNSICQQNRPQTWCHQGETRDIRRENNLEADEACCWKGKVNWALVWKGNWNLNKSIIKNDLGQEDGKIQSAADSREALWMTSLDSHAENIHNL